MNYFELINQCLLELNYRKVNNFQELIKNDHKKIMEILNIVNKEICNAYNWNFLLRRTKLKIPENAVKIENAINGRILLFFANNQKYVYTSDIEPFITGNTPDNKYSGLGNEIFISKSKKSRTADIIYYTKNCAQDSGGTEKEDMEKEDDTTVIPMPFAQQLLVYGTCLRLKANPSHVKFSYWMSMYKEALANLRSKTIICADFPPHVNLHRDWS